jgi:uncharacterized phiE125 gp8 family phage protein
MTLVPRLTIITAPAAEPVSTADLKTHMRVTGSTDDAYIDAAAKAARTYLERILNRAFILTALELAFDRFPDARYIELLRAPLSSVTSVKYTPDGGTETTFAASKYIVDTDSEPGRVVLTLSDDWPGDDLIAVNGLRVRYVSGYGTAGSSVPDDLIHALKFLAAFFFENREAAQEAHGGQIIRLPHSFDALIEPMRVLRFA